MAFHPSTDAISALGLDFESLNLAGTPSNAAVVYSAPVYTQTTYTVDDDFDISSFGIERVPAHDGGSSWRSDIRDITGSDDLEYILGIYDDIMNFQRESASFPGAPRVFPIPLDGEPKVPSVPMLSPGAIDIPVSGLPNIERYRCHATHKDSDMESLLSSSWSSCDSSPPMTPPPTFLPLDHPSVENMEYHEHVWMTHSGNAPLKSSHLEGAEAYEAYTRMMSESKAQEGLVPILPYLTSLQPIYARA